MNFSAIAPAIWIDLWANNGVNDWGNVGVMLVP